MSSLVWWLSCVYMHIASDVEEGAGKFLPMERASQVNLAALDN